jgi:integrase
LKTLGEVGALSVQAARSKAKSARVKLGDGIDPLAEKEARIEKAKRERAARRTVADVAAEYMQDLDAKESTRRCYRQLLDAHLLPRFGKREPASITEADVRRMKSAMKRTPYAFNRAAFLLGALVEKGGVPAADNPARGGKRATVKRFREASRRRYLSAAEVARLADALRRLEADGGVYIASEDRHGTVSPHAAGAIRLLMLTGARVNEVLNLRHDDIDRARGVATIRQHKTDSTSDEPKTIPLTAPVLAVLDALARTVGHPYVFEGIRPRRPLTDLRRPWQRAVEIAGLDDVRLHDLRHTVASVGASGGLAGDVERGPALSLHLVGGVLGHKSMQSTQRYAHLSDDATRDAAAQIAERIAEAMARKPGDVVRLDEARER